jgi:hypothetical protein
VRLAEAGVIVREVAAAVGLAEGEAGVRAVIEALARLEPVSIRRISRAVELPVPIVASVCGELRKRSVVAEERPARLTGEGRALFAAGRLRLEAGSSTWAAPRHALPPGLRATVREVVRVAERGPEPRFELDQCHCTVETKLRRVLAVEEAGALVGRRILLLGDDDLIALALRTLVRRYGGPSTVASLTVLDADPAVLRFLRRELDGAPFPFSCLEHDLREPLPPALTGRFDTVLTDPPYTVGGARLFLSRAAEALAGGGDVFLSFGSRRPGAALLVQRAIAEMGFTIRGLARDFNEYVGAGVLGGTSHLYHLVGDAAAGPAVRGVFRGPLYTAETQSGVESAHGIQGQLARRAR